MYEYTDSDRAEDDARDLRREFPRDRHSRCTECGGTKVNGVCTTDRCPENEPPETDENDDE